MALVRPDQGGNLPSHHRLKAYELLADGKWHDYNKVLVAVAAQVHPTRAYRYVLNRRLTEPEGEEARAAAVRTGQRDIARSALGRTQRFERRTTKSGQKQIRLKPFKVKSRKSYAESSLRGWASRRAKGDN